MPVCSHLLPSTCWQVDAFKFFSLGRGMWCGWQASWAHFEKQGSSANPLPCLGKPMKRYLGSVTILKVSGSHRIQNHLHVWYFYQTTASRWCQITTGIWAFGFMQQDWWLSQVYPDHLMNLTSWQHCPRCHEFFNANYSVFSGSYYISIIEILLQLCVPFLWNLDSSFCQCTQQPSTWYLALNSSHEKVTE